MRKQAVFVVYLLQTICNTTLLPQKHREWRGRIVVFALPLRWGRPSRLASPLLLAVLFACAPLFGAPGRAAAPRIKLLTSLLPAYCLTANIARELADVENLVPQASNPHDFQLSPRELRKLQSARVLIVNGLGLESWLPRTLAALGAERCPTIVEMASGLDAQLIFLPSPLKTAAERSARDSAPTSPSAASREGAANPHIWLDPILAAHAVTNILRALQAADPLNAEAYGRNARDYLTRLELMDHRYGQAAKSLGSSPFVTLHDAFPYLIRRYGLDLAGVIEPIPGVEPSARHFGQLLQTARQRKVRVIFTEKGENSRLASQLAADTGARLAVLDTLETGLLRPEAYEDGMLSNLSILQEELR